MVSTNSQKVWQVTARGPPSNVLKLDANAPIPKCCKGDVLVKIRAAALNPLGYKVMQQFPGFIIKRPYVPGHDFAGAVVDANNTEFRNGDEVYGFFELPLLIKLRHGTLAQYTCIPASQVARLPSNISPIQAAGVPLAALTAYQALFKVGRLEPGQHVFVNGGSTAVGAFAIQLAKAVGCHVTASGSGKNEEFVRSLGADDFVDYTKGPLHASLAANPPSTKYGIFFEAVGLEDIALYTHSEVYLAPGGIFVSTGPISKGFGISRFAAIFWKAFLQPKWLGGTKRTWKLVSVRMNCDDLTKITQYIVDGKVKPPVDSVYAFEDVPKAYERIMTGRATGKIIIKVDENAQ